jgi:hypothetical protein
MGRFCCATGNSRFLACRQAHSQIRSSGKPFADIPYRRESHVLIIKFPVTALADIINLPNVLDSRGRHHESFQICVITSQIVVPWGPDLIVNPVEVIKCCRTPNSYLLTGRVICSTVVYSNRLLVILTVVLYVFDAITYSRSNSYGTGKKKLFSYCFLIREYVLSRSQNKKTPFHISNYSN